MEAVAGAVQVEAEKAFSKTIPCDAISERNGAVFFYTRKKANDPLEACR